MTVAIRPRSQSDYKQPIKKMYFMFYKNVRTRNVALITNEILIFAKRSELRPAHTYAAPCDASRCEHIGNSSGHAAWCGAARRLAAKVSCFKMNRVVSLVLLCEEAENEEYGVRNKWKRFWVHVALLKIVLLL